MDINEESEGKIRPANEKDAEKILELFNSDLYLTGKNFKYNPDHVKEYLFNNLCKLFVYELNNEIMGIISAEFWENAKSVWVGEVIVDEKYRKRGIATQLINYLTELAKKEGMTAINTDVDINNKEMKSLLEKKGYKKGGIYFNYLKNL